MGSSEKQDVFFIEAKFEFTKFQKMMIIAPNSLFRQKEGAQAEKEEEAGDRRKAGQIGTLMPGPDALTGAIRSGVSDARNRRKHGRWCGANHCK